MDLNALITRIVNLQQELVGYVPLKGDAQEKLDKKFRLEFNYNSNHIEGNTLTYGETELYLIFDKTTGNHDGREYEEMRASDAALKMIQEYAAEKERPLTEAFIKSLNELILVRPYWVDAITPSGQPTRRQIMPGGYKKQPNSVRLQNGEMFHYTSPEETPIQMGELVEWYRAEVEKNELHPVALAALLHYKFVRIHPFDDGNGRISRLLMNYVLYANDLPPVVVKSADKKNYLFALNQADAGDINAFVEYIARQLVWSLELSIKAAKGESIEEQDDLEKEIEVWKKESAAKNKTVPLGKSTQSIQILYETNISPFLRALETRLTVFIDIFSMWTVSLAIDEVMTSPSPRFPSSAPFNENREEVNTLRCQWEIGGYKPNFALVDNFTINVYYEFYEDSYALGIVSPDFSTDYALRYEVSMSGEEENKLIENLIKGLFAHLKMKTRST